MTRYSNKVYIPGHHTLPDDMEQDWVTCHHQVSQKLKKYLKFKPNWDSQEQVKRALKKYFESKPNDDSQEHMKRVKVP